MKNSMRILITRMKYFFSYLFTLQWSKLMEGQVWQDAASQVFLSMSLGCGSLVAMGTYNKFSNNVIRLVT